MKALKIQKTLDAGMALETRKNVETASTSIQHALHAVRHAVSPITGHLMQVNRERRRVWVNPALTAARLRSLLQTWPGRSQALAAEHARLRQVLEVTKPDLLRAALANARCDCGSVEESRCIQSVMLWLWAHDAIALPSRWARRMRVWLPAGTDLLGPKRAWLAPVVEGNTQCGWDAVLLACTAAGARELGDITALTVERRALSMRNRRKAVAAHLAAMQATQYGIAADAIASSWSRAGYERQVCRHDRSFAWCTDRDPAREPWRVALAEWSSTVAMRGAVQAGNLLLDYVLAHPDVPSNPIACCEAKFQPAVSVRQYLSSRLTPPTQPRENNRIHRFFEWLMDRRVERDADGRALRNDGWRNPVPWMKHKPRPSQTHRESLPLKLVDALLRVLRDDDHAWPKTLRQDWFGEQWCPVRTVALMVALYLPLRTGQIRFLESDEGDHERYTAGQWVTVGPAQRPCRGVLRRHREHGRDTVVLHINTSKTYDRTRFTQDPGHVLAWPHPEVIASLAFLNDWQRTHNPMQGPTRWADLHDRRVYTAGADAFADMPPAWFLMRDPVSIYPNEPVGYTRLRKMWLLLMEEMDRRIQDGRADPDLAGLGRLITSRDVHGRPSRARYDLHSLRVTGLTALVTYGGLPLEFVSRHAAAHASLAMTAHYMSPSPTLVANRFAVAARGVAEARDVDLAHRLRDQRAEQAMPAVWSQAPSAEAIPPEEHRGLFCTSGLGLRPPAGVCGGVPAHSPHGNLVTGPAFLPALAQHLWAVDERTRVAWRTYRDHEAQTQRLEDAWQHEGGECPPDLTRARSRSQQARDTLTAAAAERRWVRERLAQCVQVLRNGERGVIHLIAPGTDTEAAHIDGVRLWPAHELRVPEDRLAGRFPDPDAEPVLHPIAAEDAAAAAGQMAALWLRLSGRGAAADAWHALLPATGTDSGSAAA